MTNAGVLPGIHRLELPLPDHSIGTVNCFLVEGEEGCLLVDTGWDTDESFDTLVEQVSRAGFSLHDIRQIAVTHIHPDHCGLVSRLKRATGAVYLVHEIEHNLIEARNVAFDGLLQEMTQWLLINGVPADECPSQAQASLSVIDRMSLCQPDRLVRGGEHLTVGDYDFEILWTPGHSPGHMCLYDRKNQVLISGDHIVPDMPPFVGVDIQSMSNALGDYLNSLRQVADLPVNVVLPGHRHPFFDHVKRVGEIERHYKERRKLILATLEGNRLTAHRVAETVPWTRLRVSLRQLLPLAQRLALTETIAHLELLCAEGSLAKRFEHGFAWYELTQTEDHEQRICPATVSRS